MKARSQNIISVQNKYPRLVQYLVEVFQAIDCHLVTRTNDHNYKSMIVYFVGRSQYDIEKLKQAEKQGLIERIPDFFAPVTAIPYTADSTVDLAALGRCPVIDDGFIQSLNIDGLQLKPLVNLPVATTVLNKSYPEQTPSVEELPLAQMSGDPLPTDPLERQTMVDALHHAAKSEYGIRFILDENNSCRLSYHDLLVRATNMARRLAHHLPDSLSPIIVQTTSQADTVVTLWAAWLADTSCMPLPVCRNLSAHDKDATCLQRILTMFPRAVLVTDGERCEQFVQYLVEHDHCQVLAFDQLNRDSDVDSLRLPVASGSDTALYLLTSGSTCEPKIVPLTHSQIINHCRSCLLFNHFSQPSVSLNWLPLDHSGGLFMFLLHDCVFPREQIQCPTAFVLQDPLRWLALCDQYQVSYSWAPNFAFALINNRAEEVRLQRWDLSRLNFIINAGESIDARQSHKFISLLAQHGLPAQAIIPSWGMTETCSGVTFNHHFGNTSTESLLTSLGVPVPGIDIRIVNDSGDLLRWYQHGHLQVRGEYILPCYHQNLPANAASFTDDGWFDTGDTGFIDEQGLTMVGRAKDILIINGLNIPCHVLEATINQVPGVEPGYTCVFAHLDHKTGVEGAMVAINCHQRDNKAIAELADTIQLILRKEHSVALHKLYILAADQFEKTAIGKLQRNQLLAKLNDKDLIPDWQNPLLLAGKNSLQEPCFVRRWQPQPGLRKLARPRTVALFSNDKAKLRQWQTALATHSVNTIVLLDSVQLRLPNTNGDRPVGQLVASNPDHWQQVLSALTESVNYFLFAPIGNSIDASQYQRFVTPLILALQAMELTGFFPPFSVVTFAAQRVAHETAGDADISAIASSFVRSACDEFPAFYGNCIDLPSPDRFADYITRELLNLTLDDEVAWRGDQRWVRKLEKLLPETGTPSTAKTANRLVIGGLGDIGVSLSPRLAGQGRKIAIIDNTTLANSSEEQLLALAKVRAESKNVFYINGDIVDEQSLLAAFAQAQEAFEGNIDEVYYLTEAVNLPKLNGICLSHCCESLDTILTGSDNVYRASIAYGAKSLIFLAANTDYCSGLGLASAGNRYQEVLAWRAEEEDKINVSCLSWPIHEDKEVGPIDLLGRMPSCGALSCLIRLDSDALPMRKNIRFELYPSIVVQAPIDIQRLIKDPFDNPITISPMTVAVPQPAPVDEKKAIETRLCQLWQKLLPVEKVGLHDNFFLLGGDSLLAIRLSYCISEALSVDVPVALLFQYPTVAELTPHLTQQVSTIPGRGLTCGPMSSTQQRLWFIEQYEQGTSAYHVPQLLQLANEAVGEQLTIALQLLVVRHPILRTRFFLDDQGQRVQQVGEEALSIRHCSVHPDELDNALTESHPDPL